MYYTHSRNVHAVYCSVDMLYSVSFCHIYALFLSLSVCVLIIKYSLKFIRVKIPCTMIRDKCARHKSPEQFQGNRKRYIVLCSSRFTHVQIILAYSALFSSRCVFVLLEKRNNFFFHQTNTKRLNRHRIYSKKNGSDTNPLI